MTAGVAGGKDFVITVLKNVTVKGVGKKLFKIELRRLWMTLKSLNKALALMYSNLTYLKHLLIIIL